MNRLQRGSYFLACAAVLNVAGAQEESHPVKNSPEFESSVDSALRTLAEKKFHHGLVAPSLGAATRDDRVNALTKIKSEWDKVLTDKGDPAIEYDVILQIGHFKRKTGVVGTQGKLVTEQELAAYIVKRAAEQLRANKLKVLVLSADEYAPKLRSKLFLALHADGSKPSCKTGPSLSYQQKSSTLAMHAIGWGLSQALGYNYEDFRRDGFTADAAKYYMFSRVEAPVMKGLLEVGDLTCEKMEERLVTSADGIAKNVARAIEFVLDSGKI